MEKYPIIAKSIFFGGGGHLSSIIFETIVYLNAEQQNEPEVCVRRS